MELETLFMQPITTQYKALVGVAWHKATESDQRKITKILYEDMTNRLRYFVQVVVDEARG
jgi:gamma-glutamyl-gamma-aminobutyrate hydrolase PuuD